MDRARPSMRRWIQADVCRKLRHPVTMPVQVWTGIASHGDAHHEGEASKGIYSAHNTHICIIYLRDSDIAF
eukprot:1244824-Prorocentrum_lima.AAC.1